MFHKTVRTCELLGIKVKRTDAKLSAVLELGVSLDAEAVKLTTGINVEALGGADFTKEIKGPPKQGPFHRLHLKGLNRRSFTVDSSLIHLPTLTVDTEGDAEDADRYRLKFKVTTPLNDDCKAGIWFCIENLGSRVPVVFTEIEHQDPLPFDGTDPELPLDPDHPLDPELDPDKIH